MSETCLNPQCNYQTDGVICTKCGKSQKYLRLELSLAQEQARSKRYRAIASAHCPLQCCQPGYVGDCFCKHGRTTFS